MPKKFRAYFNKMPDAVNASKTLHCMGCKAYLDAASNLEEYSTEINIPGSENGGSLSSLVLQSGARLRNPGIAPLTAASPMVSGFGNFEEISDGLNVLLIIETNGKNAEEVHKIISDMGGKIRT